MKNYGIQHFRYANTQNFTSDMGIKIRRKINPYLRPILEKATPEKIVCVNYPKLEENVPYIFCSVHAFVNDSIANLATIDRNAYLLFGTTNQLEVNPAMYAAWLNGFIYVDRDNPENRKSALDKMERILNSGSSILVFPEGELNNTENLLCQKLFSSPYLLAKRTGKLVVPVAPYYEFGSDTIYMNVGDPIDLSVFENKKEALSFLRDTLSTLVFYNIENFSTPIDHNLLPYDQHMAFMQERKAEYLKNKWTRDVWDEELARYYDIDDREYIAVCESMDNINITKDNAMIMGPILARRYEQKRYDFKQYMHDNWDK